MLRQYILCSRGPLYTRNGSSLTNIRDCIGMNELATGLQHDRDPLFDKLLPPFAASLLHSMEQLNERMRQRFELYFVGEPAFSRPGGKAKPWQTDLQLVEKLRELNILIQTDHAA